MKYLLALCTLCWLPLSMGAPNINVGVFYDYLAEDKSTYLKRVFNSGDSTAFIKVSVMEIVYNADGTSEEVELKSNPENTARDGLVATPARLIVPANGMQGTRLLYLGQRDKERYFRLRFVPVMPEPEDGFVVSSEERETYKNSLSAGVTVLAGFGTVFFVRPKHSRFATRVDERNDAYGLHNDGNSVVVVDQFKDCPTGQTQECLPVTKNHILPGRSFSFAKEAGRTYRFTLVEGGAKKHYEVKG